MDHSSAKAIAEKRLVTTLLEICFSQTEDLSLLSHFQLPHSSTNAEAENRQDILLSYLPGTYFPSLICLDNYQRGIGKEPGHIILPDRSSSLRLFLRSPL